MARKNIFCFTNFLQVSSYIMANTRHLKASLQHLLPDPKGVEEVALRGVNEQLDIVKSQLHCWFYTRCGVKDKTCSLAIDRSCEVNLASAIMVHKLNLPTIDHLQPYKLPSAHGDVWVTKHTLVPIQIGKYVDEVLCDVVPIQMTHVLLGKAWMLRREVKYDGHTNKYSFVFNGRRSALVPHIYDQLCIDLVYMKSEHEHYSMKKELDEGIVTDGVKSEGVEKEKEVENNERKKTAIEHEKEIEKSKVLTEILSFNKNESEGTYCHSNNLNIALSSVPCFVQVKQSAIVLILQCSIPKTLVQFASFHGVCLLGVRSIWFPFMESDDFNAVHVFGGSNYVYPQDIRIDHVPRVYTRSEVFNGHYNTYAHLAPSPLEAPTSPSQLPYFASLFKFEESDFIGSTSHHFEDPYLMITSDQVGHTLKLVREIQSSTRFTFQLSKWFMHWMKLVVIITKLNRRHVTLLIIVHASICGQIAFKRRGICESSYAIG